MKDSDSLDLIGTLREQGIQVTYQRLAIYQALFQLMEHPTAEEVYQHVRKRFPMISLGTVYKTLEKFYEVGLIQRVSPMTEVGRYETLADSHHHLICLKCQAILDIEDPLGGQEISLPDGNEFHVLRHQVVIHGYCPKCIKSERREG